MSYLISATWWTNSTIYIPEYSQYWYQHVVINLITTRREFTLFHYSKPLSSIITSFCIIFNICYMMTNSAIYIFQNTPSIVSACCIEFNHYKMRIYSITVFYNTLKLNHIILYHIWYLQHDKLPFYIYSRILPKLISTCCVEFNHYKTWIYSILQYSTTLSRIIASFCIIFDICYMMNQQCYIYSRILPVLISTCCIEFNH